MSKAIGIDYGKKRVGIAISDSSKIIATGLCSVQTKDIFIFLMNLIENEEIDTIVVGEAKNLDGSNTDSTVEISKFINKIKNLFNHLKVTTIDERYTSKIAFKSLIDSGVKKNKRRNKFLVDEVSATIILQDYLSYK